MAVRPVSILPSALSGLLVVNSPYGDFPRTMTSLKTLYSPLLLGITLLLVCACGQSSDSASSSVQAIQERGKLTVLTTNLPTTYYYDRDNQLTGPEYDMTQAFADVLQVEVEYKVYNSTKDVLQGLRNKEGDLAAAGLTVNDLRKEEFAYGPVYQQTDELLICRRGTKRIRNEKDAAGLAIIVAADSSYIDSLSSYPDISWTASSEYNTAMLLAQVAEQKIECTISDSTLYNIERRYHMELKNQYTLAKGSQLAWMLAKNNPTLKQAMTDFFANYRKQRLGHTLDKYYGFVEAFDYVDTHKFLARVETRLPPYKEFFIDAAHKNGIEPALLAAQSYQESHWNRKAKSPTGVRGLMMLTQPVAKSLGVTNRLHASQNIYAGATFLAKMKKMVAHVPEPDQTWLALAAYNIGRGHFRDAQSLAKKLAKDPDQWHEMKDVLPLLAQKKYYKDLRYGYARGNEPVRYVARVRSYEELLYRHFAAIGAKSSYSRCPVVSTNDPIKTHSSHLGFISGLNNSF